MFGAILKTAYSFFQKGMTFCRSIYVKKVVKLLAFIFEQSSYKGKRSKLPKTLTFQIQDLKHADCRQNYNKLMFKWSIVLRHIAN